MGASYRVPRELNQSRALGITAGQGYLLARSLRRQAAAGGAAPAWRPMVAAAGVLGGPRSGPSETTPYKWSHAHGGRHDGARSGAGIRGHERWLAASSKDVSHYRLARGSCKKSRVPVAFHCSKTGCGVPNHRTRSATSAGALAPSLIWPVGTSSAEIGSASYG